MSEEEMLMCLIAFILGYLVARMMGNRNGFAVGAGSNADTCELRESISLKDIKKAISNKCETNESAVTCNAEKYEELNDLCQWDVQSKTGDDKDMLCAPSGGALLRTGGHTRPQKKIPMWDDVSYTNDTLVDIHCNTTCKNLGTGVNQGWCKAGCKMVKSRPIIIQAKARFDNKCTKTGGCNSKTYEVDSDDRGKARVFCDAMCTTDSDGPIFGENNPTTGGSREYHKWQPDCLAGCNKYASQYKYMDVDCDAADTASGATA